MTLLPPGVKVHLALSYIDMRKGIDGLAMLVQGIFRRKIGGFVNFDQWRDAKRSPSEWPTGSAGREIAGADL